MGFCSCILLQFAPVERKQNYLMLAALLYAITIEIAKDLLVCGDILALVQCERALTVNKSPVLKVILKKIMDNKFKMFTISSQFHWLFIRRKHWLRMKIRMKVLFGGSLESPRWLLLAICPKILGGGIL